MMKNLNREFQLNTDGLMGWLMFITDYNLQTLVELLVQVSKIIFLNPRLSLVCKIVTGIRCLIPETT